MADEHVIYNGVPMHPDWPAHIEAAQEVATYTIKGTAFQRIRFGDEKDDRGADRGPCHDCGVLKGQYHVPCCDVESCPLCGEQSIACECEIGGEDGP